MKCLKRVELPARESLFHQGEEACGLFILAYGSISLCEMHSKQVRARIGSPLPILHHGKMPNSPTDNLKDSLKSMRNQSSFSADVKVVEEPGALVGNADLADRLLNASSPTNRGSPRDFCYEFTAIANTESKVLYLSREDYLRCVQDNPSRLMQEKLEIMETIPLFCKARSTLSKQAQEFIASAMTMQSYPARTKVAYKGEEARLCILLRGLC
jgi:CRP-like cAMP-binding protein